MYVSFVIFIMHYVHMFVWCFEDIFIYLHVVILLVLVGQVGKLLLHLQEKC